MTSTRTVNSWNDRAEAYDKLISRWPIFTNMAIRLIESLPDDFSGQVLDVAAGTGLLSKLLLKQHPSAEISLIEPSKRMLTIARQHLKGQVAYFPSPAESLKQLKLSANAVYCNAAFHLMDETRVFPEVAASLQPGGLFAFNLWGHSFDETAGSDTFGVGLRCVEIALEEAGEVPPPRSKSKAPRVRSRGDLERLGEESGLHLKKYCMTTDRVSHRFEIAFSAMSESWLGFLSPDKRAQIIQRALELCQGEASLTSVDFHFIKDL